MIRVNIHEAKTQLSRLIQAVLKGEEVIISNRNHPVAQLVPWKQAPVSRPLGWGGPDCMWMADDFDAPLGEAGDDFADYA